MSAIVKMERDEPHGRSRLEDMLAAPEKVPMPRGQLEVRGIGVEEISSLLGLYKDQIMAFFAGDAVDFTGLVIMAPRMVADIIALAADRESEIDAIRRIPIQYQADCLAAIYRLSVPDEKKFFQSLGRVAEKLSAARKAIAQSGSSGVTSSPSTST